MYTYEGNCSAAFWSIFFLLLGSLRVGNLREMPLKLSKLQRSIWLYSEFSGSLWLGLKICYEIHMWRVFLGVKTAYIIQFLSQTNPEIWRDVSLIIEQDLFSKVIVLSPVWRPEGH